MTEKKYNNNNNNILIFCLRHKPEVLCIFSTAFTESISSSVHLLSLLFVPLMSLPELYSPESFMVFLLWRTMVPRGRVIICKCTKVNPRINQVFSSPPPWDLSYCVCTVWPSFGGIDTVSSSFRKPKILDGWPPTGTEERVDVLWGPISTRSFRLSKLLLVSFM